MLRTLSQYAGKIIGAASGVAACGLWLWALGTPQGTFSLSAAYIAIGVLMILIAIFAVIASVRGHGLALVVMFMMSFFPVGAYLSGMPHWLRWIGVADLGFLVAGLMIWCSTPKTVEQRASVTDQGDR
jgi:ABC-type multidrug transport system permease subunit